MAIVRNPTDLDNPVNYVATLAFFCCVSCMVLMLKFRGFKATFNILSRKKEDEVATVSMAGAYRVNRDELNGTGRVYEPPKKLSPSMVKLPPSFDPEPGLRPTKSTNDLRPASIPSHLQAHKSLHDVSLDPRGAPPRNQHNDRKSAPPAPPAPPERKKKNTKAEETEAKKEERRRFQEKEEMMIEKRRLAAEKARQKAAAQKQAKQSRGREKHAPDQAKVTKKETGKSKKNAAPAQPASNPLARNPLPPPPPTPAYSTNTLDSSISRSSGPPPYSETSNIEVAQAGNSNPSNVSFGKPISTTPDSWDLISQHRQQMTRPASAAVSAGPRKNMVMDLQYKLGPADDKQNSDA